MAILDTRDCLNAKNDLHDALTEMAYSGPETLRLYFEQAVSLNTATNNLSLALREVARSREEPFFRQFFDCLANHHKGGATTAEVLTRIARGQKTQTRLQSKTRARQSGIRVVGVAYMVAPGGMALFMRFFGGAITADFYASPLGQGVQIVAALTGVFSYWLGNRIARRGLYIDEVSAARIDTAKVPTLIADDEFGEEEAEQIVVEAERQSDQAPVTPINVNPMPEPAAQPIPVAVATLDEAEPDDTQSLTWPTSDETGPIILDQFTWGKFLQEDELDIAEEGEPETNNLIESDDVEGDDDSSSF